MCKKKTERFSGISYYDADKNCGQQKPVDHQTVNLISTYIEKVNSFKQRQIHSTGQWSVVSEWTTQRDIWEGIFPIPHCAIDEKSNFLFYCRDFVTSPSDSYCPVCFSKVKEALQHGRGKVFFSMRHVTYRHRTSVVMYVLDGNETFPLL